MTLCYIIDHFHDQHSFSDTCTAKQSDFTSLRIGFKQINNLYSGIKEFCIDRQILKSGSRTMNRLYVFIIKVREMINRFSNNIHQTTFDLRACRHSQRTLQVNHFHAASQSVGSVHSYAANGVFPDMLFYFHNKIGRVFTFDLQS